VICGASLVPQTLCSTHSPREANKNYMSRKIFKQLVYTFCCHIALFFPITGDFILVFTQQFQGQETFPGLWSSVQCATVLLYTLRDDTQKKEATRFFYNSTYIRHKTAWQFLQIILLGLALGRLSGKLK
jgi:hypothetical protein